MYLSPLFTPSFNIVFPFSLLWWSVQYQNHFLSSYFSKDIAIVNLWDSEFYSSEECCFVSLLSGFNTQLTWLDSLVGGSSHLSIIFSFLTRMHVFFLGIFFFFFLPWNLLALNISQGFGQYLQHFFFFFFKILDI